MKVNFPSTDRDTSAQALLADALEFDMELAMALRLPLMLVPMLAVVVDAGSVTDEEP